MDAVEDAAGVRKSLTSADQFGSIVDLMFSLIPTGVTASVLGLLVGPSALGLYHRVRRGRSGGSRRGNRSAAMA